MFSCSLPGSSVHGISQARTHSHSNILAWEIPWTEELGGLQSRGLQRIGDDWMTQHAWTHAISSSRGSSRPRSQTLVSCIGRWFSHHWATWEASPSLRGGIRWNWDFGMLKLVEYKINHRETGVKETSLQAFERKWDDGDIQDGMYSKWSDLYSLPSPILPPRTPSTISIFLVTSKSIEFTALPLRSSESYGGIGLYTK